MYVILLPQEFIIQENIIYNQTTEMTSLYILLDPYH